MQLLNGKPASEHIKEHLYMQTAGLIKKKLRPPHLTAILIGNNGASETYIASKIKNCAEIGFQSSLIRFEENVSENELLKKIEQLNNEPAIDGILVQLPLPKHIDEQKVINAISPQKDVDGFHPLNIGNLVQGTPTFISATPYGIILLLQHYNISVKGKHAVVIGRSNIVGRPISILLSSNQSYGNATVTLCHSHTHNLKDLSLQADILIAALGKPGFVTAGMVKEGAIVIDVGITRIEDASAKKGFKLKGDVNFDEVAPKASFITPVPGGVGLMTIAALLTNTMNAYLKRNNLTEDIFKVMIKELSTINSPQSTVNDQRLTLPVMEAFYTLQGEGFHQGKAAYFIRLAGCDVGCFWCDVKESWDASLYPAKTIQEIIEEAGSAIGQHPSRSMRESTVNGQPVIVITGGEPLLHNLDELTQQLQLNDFKTHIETSGSSPLSGYWDWICLSPKKFKNPLPAIFEVADELKMIIYNKADFKWAEENALQVSGNCKLYLQPEWSKASLVTPLIIDYIKANPQWQISLQIHKYLDIR